MRPHDITVDCSSGEVVSTELTATAMLGIALGAAAMASQAQIDQEVADATRKMREADLALVRKTLASKVQDPVMAAVLRLIDS